MNYFIISTYYIPLPPASSCVSYSLTLSFYSRYSDVIDHSDPEDEDEEDEEEVVEESETGDTGGDEGGGGGVSGGGDGGGGVERQISEVAGSPCLLKPSTPTIKTQKTIRKVKLNFMYAYSLCSSNCSSKYSSNCFP